jgi:hypothetical protein
VADPLKAIEELGHEFERVAFERSSARAARPRVPRGRLLVLAALALLLAAAVAVAASGVLSGEPVRNPPGVAFTPTRGLGTPVPGSARLLGLRVPDPAGGPPWGMRTLKTTRGFGCVQIGRVVGGALGVLGQDDAFANDGRFHPKPPSVLTQADCQQPDGAGHVFIAIGYHGLPASGLPGMPPAGGCVTARIAGYARLPACPAADLRVLYYGLLGPRARSITYVDDRGQRITSPAFGPDGAYLVVERPKPGTRLGYFTPGISPSTGLVSVQYSGGRVCHLRSPRVLGGARGCPLVGYVAPRLPRLTRAQVAAPVTARFSRAPVRPYVSGGPPAPREWKLTISFRSRVAVLPPSYYVVSIRVLHMRRGCGSYEMFGPITRSVAAGEPVHDTRYVPAGCKAVSGMVSLHQPRRPDQLPYAGAPTHDLVVGTFEARVP